MQGGEAQLVTIASPTLLNEFRFGVTRRNNYTTNMQTGLTPSSVLTSITSVAQIGANFYGGTNITEQNIDFNDDVTKSKGKHTLKFGVDFQNTLVAQTNALTQQYTFANLANYLTTINTGAQTYQSATFQVGNPTVNNRWNSPNFYVQDEFRVSKNLTLNAGLRYQIILWPALDPNATFPNSRTIHTDKFDIAPRFSVSYQATPTTAIRAAVGQYFDTPNWNTFNNISLLNGNRIKTYTFTPTQAGAPTYPNTPTSAQLLASSVPNIATYDPNYRDMYSIQANAQIEQGFGSNLSVTLDYQLLTTRRGPYGHDINLGTPVCLLADGRPAYTALACGTGTSSTIARPTAGLAQIIEVSSGSNVNYHGMDLTVKKRMSHGLQFQATYTWSKALGTVDQLNNSALFFSTPIEDPTNLSRDYGPLSSDIRNNFVFEGLYHPTVSTKGFAWVNGFQISTMTYVHSGLPINVYNGSDPSGDLVSNARPLFVGRNNRRAPNLYEEDPRISYDVPFRERYHLILFSEAENIFNHPNLNCNTSSGCTTAVNNNVTSAAFLHPTSDRNARLFNFGSKITF